MAAQRLQGIFTPNLVAYDDALISGVRIGLAPIEDFAYTVAALVLLPAVWELLPRRSPRQDEHS